MFYALKKMFFVLTLEAGLQLENIHFNNQCYDFSSLFLFPNARLFLLQFNHVLYFCFDELLIFFYIVQDPLRGGKDDLFDQVVAILHSNDSDALAKDATTPPRRRLVPEVLLKLARKISPF